MTKLVAGYVLGRVTSPHQMVFVFVILQDSLAASSMSLPERCDLLSALMTVPECLVLTTSRVPSRAAPYTTCRRNLLCALFCALSL
jgi:hypothetical protein